jgi:single-stranded-DNA-specific exonuclease
MIDRPSCFEIAPVPAAAVEALRAELGVARPVAAVLARRGLGDAAAARRFLAADERNDPFLMRGMGEACERLLAHIGRGSRIVVYGDYDVDGVSSTAMLVRTLRALGASPSWRLPSRLEDGYGLTAAAVERLAADGVDLLVTVDCGVTAVGEVAAARAAGLEVIVTDHHRPDAAAGLPDCTLVHPALPRGASGEAPGPGYPFPDLCAAGVVLKLSEALFAAAGRDSMEAERDIDFAALATVCDMVPLRGENRRIVRQGLAAMARTERPGLRALMAVAKLDPGDLSEHALGFRLGPRLNAAGRLHRADASLELLMTDDDERARAVAEELDLLNLDRREAETRILFAAEAACATQVDRGAIVVAGEGWHPGVVGIVASRLVERHGRPCVVIALDGDGGRGSGRSIPAYDLHAGLSACAGLLTRFGGHRAAAGVELAAANVDRFRTALAAHAGAALAPADLRAVERVDAVVSGASLGLELAEQLEALAPFGSANPQPTLLVPAARLDTVTALGQEGRHARFTLSGGGARARGVIFGVARGALARAAGDGPHHAAVKLERNRWNGAVEPRVLLRALCPPERGRIATLGEDLSIADAVAAELRADPESWWAAGVTGPASGRALVDRRDEGVACVVADLLTAGEDALAVVASVTRRRAGLEQVLAGLGPGTLTAVSWEALAADPALAGGHSTLVAVDPPPLPGGVDLLTSAGWGLAVLAHGPAEAAFAAACWRAELDLRPELAAVYRALRDVGTASGELLERALRGDGPHPRSPFSCARLVRVLVELGLVEWREQGPECRVLGATATDLERSAAFCAYAERAAAIERRLAGDGAATAASG